VSAETPQVTVDMIHSCHAAHREVGALAVDWLEVHAVHVSALPVLLGHLELSKASLQLG
jgi:hypothetical protein